MNLKLKRFIERNKRRNKHLYKDGLIEGYDYIVCPISNERLSMIKSTYITKVLGITVQDYDEKYPKQQKICTKRIENIKGGLKNIDDETGYTKHQLSIINSGKSLTGLIRKDNIKQYNITFRNLHAYYNSYVNKISYCEETREDPDNKELLQVKCTWCGKWFNPTNKIIDNRIGALNGRKTGEGRLYCSEGCKKCCPVYNKSPATLMKEDTIKAGRLSWLELSREVQPDLRKMVFERDKYKCIKCGSELSLHCHHLEGIRWNPLESADVDQCITVCKDCHKEIHKIPGCGYHDMRCEDI